MIFGRSDHRTSDFLELLQKEKPELLSKFGVTPLSDSPAASADFRAFRYAELKGQRVPTPSLMDLYDSLLEGTTILAAVYNEGVIIAGDRQATAGFQVGERRIRKVYEVDTYSAIAIAGVAGPAMDMAKLFQVQVEFYEKIEGAPLSLEGKANSLSNMVKSNLPMALQGLVVIPIFAGYDFKRKQGKIFKYDAIGGQYEESEYYATGSGGKDAQATLKKLYSPDMSRDDVLKIIAEALWDAADEDVATGGPDFIREIFPTMQFIDATGISEIPDSEVKALYTDLLDRLRN